jgi:hypothetical protein
MTADSLKSFIALAPACMLLAGSVVLRSKGRPAGSLLQLIGAECLVLVVLAHVCEELRLFPSMHWGEPHSAGHYLDLSSAVLGLTLFPSGYLRQALAKRRRP